MEPSRQLLLLELIDYLLQAVLLVLGFIHPWFAPRCHGWRVFGYPLLVSFLWCVWRMVLFDPLIKNDAPGIGYLFTGLLLGLIGVTLYGARCCFTRSTAATSDTNRA